MSVDREPPPPGLVAAAEQDYHHRQGELVDLMSKVRELMAARHTEVEAVTDLWLTFLLQDPRRVALLASTAVMQLIKADNGREPPRAEVRPSRARRGLAWLRRISGTGN